MFKLEISTANAAFHDSGPTACADELARLLRDIADSVEAGNEAGSARDNNGNRCGGWSITETDGESLEDIAADLLAYKAAEFEGTADDCSINGGDMVDDFAAFRDRIKAATGKGA